MKKINCIEPVTLESKEAVNVYDNKKNIFYHHPNKEGYIKFNLPIGTFFVDCVFNQIPFEPYEKFIKPQNYINPLEFKLFIKHNPNKATINIGKRTIIISPEFAYHKYKPTTTFILCHEIAHTWVGGDKYLDGVKVFDAEKKCDEFAKNFMLSHGWNPTQILLGSSVLSRSDRKACIHNFIKNTRR